MKLFLNKIKYFFFIFILFFSVLNFSFAEENNKNLLDILKINKNISINKNLEINLEKIESNLKKQWEKILFEWNIPWEKTIYWSTFKKKFKTFWEKEINLNIYKIKWNNRELIANTKIYIFVYKNKIISIFDKSQKKEIKDFILKAKESWVFLELVFLDNFEIEKYNFKEKIFSKLDKNSYLLVWWTKDFIFDILSKINTLNPNSKINFVWVSPFNIFLLENLLQNFISNKTWINKALLLPETSKFEILKQPTNIEKLENDLKTNNYNYINLNSKSKIHNFLFLSKFINNLSNFGFSINNIYLILIIPFLLFWVSVFKHLIWLTPAWILIPIASTILFLKIWFIYSSIILIIFFITNLLLSKIIQKYNMHYTPKVSMLVIINIIIFIVTINIFINNKLIKIDINDIIFIILFVLIAEKLVNIITSKEFWEYKLSLINTFIFSIFSYLFFSINFIKTFILAYPEIIIILIPFTFIIWRFTGLRVTEYFRFKEIIKSIEE